MNRCTNPHCDLDDPTNRRTILGAAFLCVPCGNRLERWLTGHTTRAGVPVLGLVALHQALAVRLASTGQRDESGVRAPGRPIGLALNDEVAEHRQHMRRTLAAWCDLVVEQRGVNSPATREIQVTVPFLVTNLDWLLHHRPRRLSNRAQFGDPVAPIFYGEVAELRGRAFGLAYSSSNRGPIHLGACPEDECIGDLWTVIRFEWERRPWQIQCDYCPRTWDTTQFMKLGQRLGKPCGVVSGVNQLREQQLAEGERAS